MRKTSGLLLAIAVQVLFCFSEAVCEIDPVATAISHTKLLEGAKAQIDYCVENLGKNIGEVDLEKVGARWDFNEVCIVTYGLIGKKYYMQYGDSGKAADYYYLEWRDTPGEPCAWPEGEYTPFSNAMAYWEQAGRYKELAEHYEEYILAAYSPLKSRESTKEEKWKDLHLYRPSWPDDEGMGKSYQEDLKKWAKYKKLAKTAKPKPLEPAMQNHEWFYSDKQVEVLKSLTYYNKYKVKFMLEKALGHKDPVVAKKAKEYLETLNRNEKNVEKSK